MGIVHKVRGKHIMGGMKSLTQNMVEYASTEVTYDEDGEVTLPEGAVVVDVFADVSEAFDTSTSETQEISVGDITDIDADSTGRKRTEDELDHEPYSEETDITVSGDGDTEGEAIVTILYHR